MSGYFVPGWHPEYAMAAKEEMDKIGGYVTADYGDTSELPPAMSLSAYLHWSYDQGPVGSCLPPGVLITMSDGHEKAIEEIRLFDTVVTAEGRYGTVTATMGREVNEDLFCITLHDRRSVECTSEHPIFTGRGYVKASDLSTLDTVIVPVDKNTNICSHHCKMAYSFAPIKEGIPSKTTHVDIQIKSIVRRPYCGKVYNIEVSGDNSYVANGMGVHNCFAVAATQAFQVLTSADNSDGYAKWDLFPLSRAFVWYEGRRRDGLLGSRMDGGSVTNAMLAMKEPGVPRESTWPYKPNHSFLERKPAEDAYTEAKENRVTAVASVPIDQWKRSIKNLNPITIGIWWPYGWDNQINTSGQAVTIGQGTFGHALVVIGYIEDWNGKLWWQIENSHGAIYHPIPPDIQKRVPGYIGYSANDPSRVFSFWVRDDMLREVLGYGNQETIVAAGLSGFRAKPLPWSKVL